MPEKYYAERLEITVGREVALDDLGLRLSQHANSGWELDQFKPEWGDSQRDGRYHTGRIIIVLKRESGSIPDGLREHIA